MNQKIVTHKIKIFTIVFLSLGLIVIIEGLLMMNDCSGVLMNFTKTPSDVLRYLPIIILLYLFSNEMILSSNNNSLLKITPTKKGIVFIKDYHIWLAIFETFSVGKIQTSELKQLKHLKIFSLELDRKRMSIRVVLYSKSYKELEERINDSKPILEVVLPDIHFISKRDTVKLYSETELLKIGKEYILKEKTELIYPQFADVLKKSSPSISRMILACNIPEKPPSNKNVESMNCVQIYFYHSYDQTSFFKYMNKRFFNSQRGTAGHFKDIQELQRIRLKYQTDKRHSQTFQEGFSQFIAGLSLISTKSEIDNEVKQHTYPLIPLSINKQELNPLDPEKQSSTFEMNQICSELCNFPKENKLLHDEKEKRCRKRAVFCQKLLVNANFSSILENLLNQKDKTNQIHLIAELRQHLSYQQLICCLSHLSKQYHPQITYRKLVNLIHVLFWSNFKGNEDPEKKLVSLMFSHDRNIEHITPSLAQN
ncbi:MAG: hypothetical protein ACXADY_26515 [Candidatus Hodarchaeales archaeon]